MYNFGTVWQHASFVCVFLTIVIVQQVNNYSVESWSVYYSGKGWCGSFYVLVTYYDTQSSVCMQKFRGLNDEICMYMYIMSSKKLEHGAAAISDAVEI